MGVDVETILNDLIARVGRVRRWLLAISVLRIAALGLAFASLYVGLYAWLDHHIHFGRVGRVSAFVLFVSLIAAGLYAMVRVLRRERTYAYAANYIESRRSFDQQLVAAVEYYEGRRDYPYSEPLARQLVRQVDRAAEGCRLDATVDKWQGYLLSGLVLLGLLVVGLFIRQNVLYISAYLSRLVRPFAAVAPLPAATLETTTGDLVTSPDVPVAMAALARGRIPQGAALVLTGPDVNDGSSPQVERIETTPISNGDGTATLKATKSFDAPGHFEYRFETRDARSDSHTIAVCEPPAIESITANVAPPSREGMPPVPSYEQQVTDQKLEVLAGSRVELKIRATKPLREATMSGPEGPQRRQSLQDTNSVSFQFTADQPSSLTVSAVSTEGLPVSEPQELRIVLKSDGPPQFKLVSPEGDYLATDVASVPIAFEVTDDFGLRSAQLLCELPSGAQMVLDSTSAQNSKQLALARTLELEQYDLHVGDSILFYATAQDIDTGQRRTDANGCSEVYFIEIRPYQQYWHSQPGSSRPSSQSGPVPEDLITVLEYTRAIVKKTWALAHTPQGPGQDRVQLESLAADVQYCARQLAKIRDDPEAGFSDSDKAVLNRILEDYGRAEGHLARHDAKAALPPEENAYRTLRKFIDELHLKWSPPQSGQSPPQEAPERIRLQEQPQEAKMEKERIESHLKEMQRKIEALARQQQSLKADLEKALQQDEGSGSQKDETSKFAVQDSNVSKGDSSQDASAQSARASSGQPKGNEQGETSGQNSPAQSGDASGQGGQSGAGEGQGGGSSAMTPAAGGTPGESAASGAAAQAQAAQAQSSLSGAGDAGGAAADPDARLRMLQARQQALREQTAQLGEQLGGLPVPEYSTQGKAQHQGEDHLQKAVEAMKKFEEKLADARYEPPAASERPAMTALADAAARRLADAGQALRQGASGDEQMTPDKAQEIAEQLAEDAQAYDESLSEAEKQQMLARLEAARRLLESMAGPQWTTVFRGGGPAAGHVYTSDPHTAPAEAARLLARQFWSAALAARQRRSRPLEEEPSDVEFFETENEFFESAAKFRRQGVEP